MPDNVLGAGAQVSPEEQLVMIDKVSVNTIIFVFIFVIYLINLN